MHSWRLYNETGDPEAYQVAVKEVLPPGRPSSDFFLRLQRLVQADQILWSRFSQTVAEEVSLRVQKLKERINT